MSSATLWGIDLGGTKIEGAIIDGSNRNQVIERLRLPTEQEKGYYMKINKLRMLL